MKNNLRKHIAALLSVAMLATALPPRALAGVVGTDAITATAERERVLAVLSRADLRAKLEAYGVNAAEVKARVDALSDQEAAELAARIDALPAGGDGLIGAIVLVFLVL